MLAARLAAAGLSAAQAAAITGTVADTLTATGTTLATAKALPADVNRFTTVALGTGAVLPLMNPGDWLEVINAGGNALALYPPNATSQVNALGNGTAYSIATATPYCTVTCINPGQYHCFQSA